MLESYVLISARARRSLISRSNVIRQAPAAALLTLIAAFYLASCQGADEYFRDGGLRSTGGTGDTVGTAGTAGPGAGGTGGSAVGTAGSSAGTGPGAGGSTGGTGGTGNTAGTAGVG